MTSLTDEQKKAYYLQLRKLGTQCPQWENIKAVNDLGVIVYEHPLRTHVLIPFSSFQ